MADNYSEVSGNEGLAYWDALAQDWDPRFRGYEDSSRMGAGVPSDVYEALGEEWGSPVDVDEIIDRYVRPFVDETSSILEIGAGGGRLTRRYANMVQAVVATDIAPNMVARLATVVSRFSHVKVQLVNPGEYASFKDFDFALAFDVLVHLDPHTVWSTIRDLASAVRPGGHVLLHTAAIESAEGWETFKANGPYRIPAFSYLSTDMVKLFVERSGMSSVLMSSFHSDNFYERRDLITVARVH